MSTTCPTTQPYRLLVSPDGMRGAQQLRKYWITACDAQRCVIFNKVITTGSADEARIIAESCVSAEHHGSICITDESNNPAVDGDTGLPTFRAVAVAVGAPALLYPVVGFAPPAARATQPAAEAPCA